MENLAYNPSLIPLTKEKRRLGILAEVLLWKQVRNRSFHQIDSDRQRIIANYIVDFYVKTLGLVVETDGSSHHCKQEYDLERNTFLEGLGLPVFRITDWDVKQNLNAVMKSWRTILLRNILRPNSPPPEGWIRAAREDGVVLTEFNHILMYCIINHPVKNSTNFRHPSKGVEFTMLTNALR